MGASHVLCLFNWPVTLFFIIDGDHHTLRGSVLYDVIRLWNWFVELQMQEFIGPIFWASSLSLSWFRGFATHRPLYIGHICWNTVIHVLLLSDHTRWLWRHYNRPILKNSGSCMCRRGFMHEKSTNEFTSAWKKFWHTVVCLERSSFGDRILVAKNKIKRAKNRNPDS